MYQQSVLSSSALPLNSKIDFHGLAKIQPNEIKKVVFNGGGAKGVAHPVAFAALLACGAELKNLDAVAGTSAGSIIACLVACAYTPDEMHQIMQDMDLKAFLDESGAFNTRDKMTKSVNKKVSGFPSLFSILPVLSKAPVIAYRESAGGGIYDGEVFRLFIEDLIARKIGIPFCTFNELAIKVSQDPNFKNLTVVVYHHNTGKACFLNHKSAPDMIISDAIRASMAIPGFFKPHGHYQKVSGTRVQVNTTDLYVDGGLTDNYPINCFDFMPSGDEIFNREVIGLMITSSEKAAYFRGDSPMPYQDNVHRGVTKLAQQNIGAALTKNDSDLLNSPKNLVRTIALDNKGVNTLDFNLKEKPEQYNAIIRSSWDGVCNYFENTAPMPEKYCLRVVMSPSLRP